MISGVSGTSCLSHRYSHRPRPPGSIAERPYGTMMLAAMSTSTLPVFTGRSRATRVVSSPAGNARTVRTPRATPSSDTSPETTDADSSSPLLVIVECDGVLCDVHLDGHREAFNETFVMLGMEGMSWSTDEYLSLLRSGGGSAYGMLERYFSFYGYPFKELREPGSEVPDEEYVANLGNLGIVPEGYEDASLASRAAAAQAAAAQDPVNKEVLAARRAAFIEKVIDLKDETFTAMVAEGRLKLRKGALSFLDECLLEDNTQIIIIGATASAPEEGVLPAVMRAMGPLRAAAISVSNANEIIDGGELAKESENTPTTLKPSATDDIDNDSLEGFGDHTGSHDASWEAAKKEMQMAMKAKKGELLSVEVGGDLQRQSFNSNVIVDASVFCTSTRSVINATSLQSILDKKGVATNNAIFIGASRTTATEANAANIFNVVCRTANQADSQIVGVAMVVDDFGGGGGLTLRYVKARMQTWTGETVGGKEI